MRYANAKRYYNNRLVQWLDGNWYEIMDVQGQYLILGNGGKEPALAYPEEIISSVKGSLNNA